MEEQLQLIDDDLNQWFSTYGVITAERILNRYQIRLQQTELLTAIKTPYSFYHRLLQVPLRNVLNGIIMQQAYDYHVYAQKLFIDYLLSGESGKDEEAQGGLTRENIENERKLLVLLGGDYNKMQSEQDALIATSQANFIKITRVWNEALESGLTLVNATLKNSNIECAKSLIRNGLSHALVHCDFISNQSNDSKYLFIDKMNEIIKVTLNAELKDKLIDNLADLLDITIGFGDEIGEFSDQAKTMGVRARSFRTQFYETILRVTELLKLLPEYKINPEQDSINRESLYFDKTIGENS